ncbi:ubiquinol-cytochrome C chaperone family protein [Pseudorhodoplanes sp.]|uniref:ubiquinol-cytochrome C chaperone family protein n=1 Tax=Pseudorhodoplanes sp. TaxID=1934341 RepID=UPI002CA92D8C|nr:ubiquinol-cytochrome C chaperone family protein [Pseudorhodoplanes sp.]HWV51305.1 ubiquinol-cytochrome C chaperone family protein [Pseudorhodoplanes sp.]
MLNVFRRKPQAATIDALYGAIVARARTPVFYLSHGVADTVNGRLDLIMLHLALVFERLSQGDAAARTVGQAVFDRFLQDMDDHLREEGVSDLKVPKDMKRVGAAFFGRHRAYISALKTGDREGLRGALRRNVFLDQDAAGLDGMVAYVEAAAQALQQQDIAGIAAGRIDWPDPAGRM